jgi:hypothetical protein
MLLAREHVQGDQRGSRGKVEDPVGTCWNKSPVAPNLLKSRALPVKFVNFSVWNRHRAQLDEARPGSPGPARHEGIRPRGDLSSPHVGLGAAQGQGITVNIETVKTDRKPPGKKETKRNMTTYDNIWQHMTTYDNIWQHMTIMTSVNFITKM